MKEFIHLHNHTHFSLLDAISSVDGLVNAAVENKMKAVAITDHGVMFGAMEFYKKCLKNNIKPIIGCEVYVAQSSSRFEKAKKTVEQEVSSDSADGLASSNINYAHLILLAKDFTGYKNLLKIVSIGHTEGYYYKPRVDLEVLNQYREGLVATSACAGGVISCYITRGDMDTARKMTGKYKDIFGDDFYLEIQDHKSIEAEKKVLKVMPSLAKEFGLKLIATNDVHYIKKEHAIAHNIYLNLSAKQSRFTNSNDVQTNLRYGTDEIYFKSAEEMINLFKDYPEAIKSTLEVTEKCNLELDTKSNHMPNFKIPASEKESKNLDDYLRKLSFEGLKKRNIKITDEYETRLNYELEIVKKMNFSGYFLIVMDFINKAKELGVLVGPGRGSAAGSLVCYALGITEVDPIIYNLFFERFLNPSRISMPDIDIDFQDDRRDELIQYAKEKYGENSVAQIITFNKLAPRGVLKDVGRVLNFNFEEINNLTKHIPIVFGKVTPLKKCLEEVKDFQNYFKTGNVEEKKKLFNYASTLENLNKNSSIHASGIVIAPSDITDFVPLSKVTGEDNVFCTQYDMNQLEDAGLIKMDFLGLKELKVIGRTLKLINEKYKKNLSIDKIPLDDKKTYELFSSGSTIGIFQFSKSKMREYLAKLKPQSINDLSAMNALYRPGPMKLIPDFIDRKFGRKPIDYLHPDMERALKDTYGVIVYQEQVMEIARDIAGFTMAQADNMRKAMGKKIADLMKTIKSEFIEGAISRGYDKKIAEQIFTLMADFADYGFNKSHAVAYSILAYYTAYLKANFPLEFLAVSMACRKDSETELQELANECKKMGVTLNQPNINQGEVDFKVNYFPEGSDSKNIGELIYGLSALKNLGEKAVEAIIKERIENGNFKDFLDFLIRVDLRVVNKKALESLIYAGAFDEFETNRKKLLINLERATNFAQRFKEQSENNGQEGLFGEEEQNQSVNYKLDDCEPFEDAEKFNLEKSILGFYLTGHPLAKYEAEIKEYITLTFSNDFTDTEFNKINPVKMAGVINNLQRKISKKGKEFAVFKLIDFDGSGECVVFNELFKEKEKIIDENALVMIEGNADENGDEIKVTVDKIYPIEELHTKNASNVLLVINKKNFEVDNLNLIKKAIDESQKTERTHSGTCKLCFQVIDNGHSKVYISKEYKINPNQELISNLKKILGEGNLKIN